MGSNGISWRLYSYGDVIFCIQEIRVKATFQLKNNVGRLYDNTAFALILTNAMFGHLSRQKKHVGST